MVGGCDGTINRNRIGISEVFHGIGIGIRAHTSKDDSDT